MHLVRAPFGRSLRRFDGTGVRWVGRWVVASGVEVPTEPFQDVGRLEHVGAPYGPPWQPGGSPL